MKRAAVFTTLAIALLASPTADAHFKLQQPADWLVTDDTGDPAGLDGTQKENPCGAGTESGAVTTVQAGATLHVKLTETVAHGGHYRIALVPKLAPTSDDLPEPKVTLVNGSCSKADVMSPVAAPVLADGLFDHTQAQFGDGKVWETDVVIPADVSGDATLQIIEFMTPHAPQCFYHHCAKLKIESADGVAPDGGSSPSSSSSSGGDSSGGCSTSGSAPSLVTMSVGALAALTMLRRRRKT